MVAQNEGSRGDCDSAAEPQTEPESVFYLKEELKEYFQSFVLEQLEDAGEASKICRRELIENGFVERWVEEAKSETEKWKTHQAATTVDAENASESNSSTNSDEEEHFDKFYSLQALVCALDDDESAKIAIAAGCIETIVDQIKLGDDTLWSLIQNIAFVSRHLTHPELIRTGIVVPLASAIRDMADKSWDELPSHFEEILESASNLAF